MHRHNTLKSKINEFSSIPEMNSILNGNYKSIRELQSDLQTIQSSNNDLNNQKESLSEKLILTNKKVYNLKQKISLTTEELNNQHNLGSFCDNLLTDFNYDYTDSSSQVTESLLQQLDFSNLNLEG